jgi:TP901 family phage tail tape measure protein
MPEIVQKLGFDASNANRNLTNLTKKLNEANTAMGNLQTTAKAGQGLEGVTKGTKNAAKGASELTASWKTMARVVQTQIVVRGINLLIQSMKEGVESARELGLAVAEVQTISGRAQSNRELTASIVEMSSALSSTPLELTEGLYQTLSNQVVETGEALEFTARASRLATVTASETGDAVNALSSVMNSYGLASSQAEHVSGTLFKTVELGRLRLSEIANVIGRVTPLTAELGISWEETAASIAVMTRQGVRADTAITQLRAVVTKILKPTAEMSAIFHKWGVQDGKQAIQTFGGLTGVLRKLAEETGGSSAEMAELFRRVRAIIGQMGIMTDDGKLVAEVMGEISDATTEASDAWDEFIEADAQKLTLEMQKFENALTNIGTSALPAVTLAFEAANIVIEKQLWNWGRILGIIGVADIAANTYAAHQKEAAAEIEAINKKHAENQRERFKGLSEANAQFLVVAAQEEMKLKAIRDDSISSAQAAAKDAGKNILDFYRDQTKALEQTIKDANKQIKDGAQNIADIQQTIDDRLLATELSKAKTQNAKLQILDKKLLDQKLKAAKAIGEIDATQDTKEAALAANETAIGYAKQGLEIAKNAGNTITIAKWEARILDLLRGQQQIERISTKKSEKVAKAAEKQLEARKKGESELTELVKQRQELIDSGAAIGEEGPEKAAALARLAEIDKKIVEVLGDAKNGQALLDSLGLDSNFAVVTTKLTAALNASRKDWEAEAQRAQDAFEKQKGFVQESIDPTGAFGRAGEALGVGQDPGVDAQTNQRAILEASQKLLIDEADQRNKVLGLQKRSDTVQKTYTDTLGAATKELKAQEASIEKRTRLVAQLANLAGAGVGEGQVQERVATAQQEQLGLAQQLTAEFTKVGEIQSKNQLVDAATLHSLNQRVEAGRISGELTSRQVDFYQQLLKYAVDATVAERNRAKAAAELPAQDKVKAAQGAVEAAELEAFALRLGVDATAEMQQKLEAVRNKTTEAKTEAKKLGTETGNAGAQAAGVATNVAAVGTAAGTAATGVGGITTALKGANVEAERLVATLAAAGGGAGAVAYHGGPMNRYFAAGGSPRGQDKINTMLSKGETVTNAKSSQRFFSELNAINQGSQPVFREQGGQVTNVGDVNVTVNGGDSSQQTVREIGHALRREVQRGNVKLR